MSDEPTDEERAELYAHGMNALAGLAGLLVFVVLMLCLLFDVILNW